MIRVAMVLVIAACAADDGGPRLESVMPAASARNTTVTLAGTRLCGPAIDCTQVGATVQLGVDLPVLDAPIAMYSSTTASIVIPSAAPVGATSIIVTVNGQSSNALGFEVTP